MERLKKFLEKQERETKIKIGADNGSSWFYVGTVGDFLDNEETYEEKDISYFDNRVNSASDNLDIALNADTSYSGYAKQQYRQWKNKSTRPNFTVQGYNTFLEYTAKQMTIKFQSFVKERTIRAERLPIMSREIVETRKADRVADPGVLNILITGYEKGAFWVTEEADGPTVKFGSNDVEE